MPERADYEVTVTFTVPVKGTIDDPADVGHRAVEAIVDRSGKRNIETVDVGKALVTDIHIRRIVA